jgi:hypothetical protein
MFTVVFIQVGCRPNRLRTVSDEVLQLRSLHRQNCLERWALACRPPAPQSAAGQSRPANTLQAAK